MKKLRIITIISLSGTLLLSQSLFAKDYIFPVIGPSHFSNDYLAPRSNGPHHAIDIIANKQQQIVSRTDGTVTYVAYPEPSWGFMVTVRADNGYDYRYLHINNDIPGTDNGDGGGYYAYGPDIVPGKRVVKGQLLGYVGDSGNAENTVSHLHFEVYDNGNPKNPYPGLVNNSDRISRPISNYPVDDNEILPVNTKFRGGGTLSIGDVDGDTIDEFVFGSGSGGRYVKSFEQDGTLLDSFTPNGPDFLGGTDVATSDVDMDGVDEIITVPLKDGKYVKVYELDGTLVSRFLANDDDFRGGLSVATGDVDMDGVDEIIVGEAAGGDTVRVFESDGTLISSFRPYGSFKGGINVASGDVTGGNEEEIVTGARKKGGPRVSVFDSTGSRLNTYYAYTTSFTEGIRVGVAEVNGLSAKSEIITVPENGGRPLARIFSGEGQHITYSEYFAEEWWRGHYDIATSANDIYSTIGIDRRSSIRQTNLP